MRFAIGKIDLHDIELVAKCLVYFKDLPDHYNSGYVAKQNIFNLLLVFIPNIMSTKQSTASCFLWLENVRQYIILICCLICFDSTQSIVTRHFCNKTFKLMKVLRFCLIWSLWLELFKLLDCRYIFKTITKNIQTKYIDC